MAPHTATGEWKSFEIRMRRRRAERLVLRADVALEAGYPDEARGLIEEARKLWGGAPGLADLESRLRAAEEPEPAASSPDWKRAGLISMAALIAVASATTTIVLRHRGTPVSQDTQVVVERPAPAPVPTTGGSDISPAPVAPESAAPEPAPSVSNPTSDQPIEATRTSQLMEEPGTDAGRMPRQRYASPPAIPSTAADFRPDTIPAVETAAVMPPATEVQPVLLASSAIVAPAPPISGSAPTIEPPQEALVRVALDGYAAAYSRLDADAAQRVYPLVNRSALTRAFDNLASQQVSLGDCRIQVDGAAAQARCTGSATWTPKVGGGEHTDARNWTFDLSSAGGRWQIVSARVQNR